MLAAGVNGFMFDFRQIDSQPASNSPLGKRNLIFNSILKLLFYTRVERLSVPDALCW